MCTGSDSGLDPKSEENPNGWDRARGVVLKTLVLIGGALLVRRLTKSTTRWDHAGIVAQSLSGEKVISSNALSCFHLFSASSDSELLFLNSQFSKQQAARDPDSYFNLRYQFVNSFRLPVLLPPFCGTYNITFKFGHVMVVASFVFEFLLLYFILFLIFKFFFSYCSFSYYLNLHA